LKLPFDFIHVSVRTAGNGDRPAGNVNPRQFVYLIQAFKTLWRIDQFVNGTEAAGNVPNLPILNEHESVSTVGLLLVTGDRGLAGAFNANLIREARNRIARLRAGEWRGSPTRYLNFTDDGLTFTLPFPGGVSPARLAGMGA
jgi:hypothetical protein